MQHRHAVQRHTWRIPWWFRRVVTHGKLVIFVWWKYTAMCCETAKLIVGCAQLECWCPYVMKMREDDLKGLKAVVCLRLHLERWHLGDTRSETVLHFETKTRTGENKSTPPPLSPKQKQEIKWHQHSEYRKTVSQTKKRTSWNTADNTNTRQNTSRTNISSFPEDNDNDTHANM